LKFRLNIGSILYNGSNIYAYPDISSLGSFKDGIFLGILSLERAFAANAGDGYEEILALNYCSYFCYYSRVIFALDTYLYF